ncbi:MAG: DNA-binding protein YbiB [Burkholderiaceae bacterium]
MSIAPYLREIGRGKDGARSLDRAQARDLMSQVLDGQVSDLEIGAFAIAMRVKGESLEELGGFLDAADSRCLRLAAACRPTIVLPSYNGARKLPNLTALLALLLAQEDVQVLVHGLDDDAGRVTTAAIFRDLGLPFAREPADVTDAWGRREPVFMRTSDLCPPLARLLDVRQVIGLRNSGHTIAKLLQPCGDGPVIRVVNHTHPDYATLQNDFLVASGAHALSLRGTEGEPVADPRRTPRLDVYIGGILRTDLSGVAQEGVLTALPLLPRSHDAATTALYIQSVVSGERPAPPPVLHQVECLVRALAAIGAATTPSAQSA